MGSHDWQPIESMQKRRLRHAAVLVFFTVIAGAFALCAEGVAKEQGALGEYGGDSSSAVLSSHTYVGRIFQSVIAGAEIDAAIEDAGFKRVEGSEVPQYIEDEIYCTSDYPGAFRTDDWGLICVYRNGGSKELLDEILQSLAIRGWMQCESGCEGLATCIKEEGECRWLMIECVQIGDEASAVLHIGRA